MLKQVDPQIPRCLYSNRGIRLDTIRPAGKHLRLEPATVERVQQDDPGDIYYTIKMCLPVGLRGKQVQIT